MSIFDWLLIILSLLMILLGIYYLTHREVDRRLIFVIRGFGLLVLLAGIIGVIIAIIR